MQGRENFNPKNPEYMQKYSTAWGNITFDELYHRTSNVIAGKLRRDNLSQEDVEDCLQVAFLKIWRKLQKNPHMYANKTPSYILQSVYFYTKVPRVSQVRHVRKSIPSSEISWIADTYVSIHRLETWIDIQIAIAETVEATSRMSPFAIFALYSLITTVSVKEVAEAVGCSYKTMTTYRNNAREILRIYLTNYRDQPETNNRSMKFVHSSITPALFAILD